MIEPLGRGLHDEIAGGRMKNLPAGGDPAGRNERARAHQSGPSHVMLPLRRSAGVNSSRGDATTMRARRSSSKPAAVHSGVTALFTFPPVHRVSSFAAKSSGEPARTPMKMIAIATVIADRKSTRLNSSHRT